MTQAIWTLLKLLIITGIVIFLMEQEGMLRVEWADYVISVQLGMALVAILLALVCLLFIHKIVIHLLGIPKIFRSYWKERSLRESHTSLTSSLVALAAGDYKHAAYHAYRAQKLLPAHYDMGVATFIEAHAARLLGQNDRASLKFNKLLEKKESAFLGIRGLMQTEIEAKNYEIALEMAYQADRRHPKQVWIVKTIYDLEIKTYQWARVLATLKKLEKLKALDSETIRHDRKAILVMLADEALGKEDVVTAKTYLKTAFSLDAGFIPASTRLIHLAIERGQKRKAKSLIEQSWKISPHPELVKFWDLLAPENTPSKPASRLEWYERLIVLNPNAVEGQLAVAQVALDDGLWGKARTHLAKAEKLDNHAGIYLAWAELERLSTQNEDAIFAWLKKAQNAKQPKQWVCCNTGQIYETWYAIAQPHGLFNTIEWTYPNQRQAMSSSNLLISSPQQDAENLLLSAS